MRFDDRLNTVLAQPAANAHDRTVRWRQLVELLARASDLGSPVARQALAEVRAEAPAVDEQLRAAAARAIARPQLPTELVAAFAADSVTVSAPILAAVSLSPDQWEAVLASASPESRRFARALHPDLPEAVPAPEAEPAPKTKGKRTVPPEEPQAAAPSAVPSISEVLARIERIRQERQRPPPERPRPRARSQRSAEGGPALFRWECGPSGEIAWVDGVPRGALVGRSLANPGEHNGVDKRIQRAFALRAPFRDADLHVSGEGPAAGGWKLSGIPAFEPADGRFAGYRGVAVRSSQEEHEEPRRIRPPLDDNALRELVHELKTPLNAIIGFAEIIEGQYLGPAEDSYRARAAEIVAQARLLLSAIEDLDLAAQLRAGGGQGAADLKALLTELLPDFKDRSARAGAAFELSLSRTVGQCSVDENVLERLVRRYCGALIDAAAPRERLQVVASCDVGQCIILANRPQSLRGLGEQDLFGAAVAHGDILASGFALKLVRGLAQTVGGDLRLTGDRIALVLPRRSD
ncbi:MAG TPA: histidine kinase dimerization/phospho-acceptor domain-containing protein [Sphingomicrobium sp.]|nr:histidine kinase dimerization/phospho-acceptor domain-containing protein [Sphingomicrobium sp.]